MFHNTSGSKLKELAYETGCFTSSSSSSSMLPYLIPEMMIIPYFTFHLCHKTHHLMISEIICVTSYMVSVSGQHKEFVMSFHYIFFLFSWWGYSKSFWTPGNKDSGSESMASGKTLEMSTPSTSRKEQEPAFSITFICPLRDTGAARISPKCHFFINI